MVSYIRGRYINLDKSIERREKLDKHLEELGLQEHYSRFEAIRGGKDQASKSALRPGELGLWLSWLNLLEEEISNEENYEYLHIIEDDVIMSEKLSTIIKSESKIKAKFDILMTDMYVNTSIYLGIKDEYRSMAKSGRIGIKENFYSGCTASCMIRKDKLKKVYNVLLREYKNNSRSIPLDNALHLLRTKKELVISATVPFLTTIRREEIEESTIQGNDEVEDSVKKSRELCTLLRRHLSLIEANYDTVAEIFNCVKALETMHIRETKEDKKDLLDTITKYAHNTGILRFEYRKNLIGQPGNKQKEKD